MSSYTAPPNTDGQIQKIYVDFSLPNGKEVWMVEYKDGKKEILNLVNPFALKFDGDRIAVQKAQEDLQKKNPRTTICTIM
jgi:hypothetical protein